MEFHTGIGSLRGMLTLGTFYSCSYRISRILAAKLVMFPSPTLTVILPVKGTSYLFGPSISLIRLARILEYLNREDAERAVKELDGRDLRGQAVRVDLFEDVSTFLSTDWRHTLNTLDSATPIITAGMTAVNIVMNATGTNAIIEKSVTAMIAMTVTVKKGRLCDVIGRVLLPVVAKTIVVPGHLPIGGILKIEGLQGTMIDEEAMMTGEVLTLIMIVAGTTAGKTAVATKRRNGLTTGLPDTMGTAGGVEGGCRVVMVRGPSKMKGTERATDPPDG